MITRGFVRQNAMGMGALCIEHDEWLPKKNWFVNWKTGNLVTVFFGFCTICIITSAKEVMFLPEFVCLFVC